MRSTTTEHESARSGSIGLFGGSFNPVHIGHLLLARDACETLALDRLDFVLAASPPHKLSRLPELAPAEERWRMLERALEGEPRMRPSRVELDRGGVSYTIDTVRWYREACPGAELYLMIGADSLFELRTWRDSRELVRLCRIVTLTRPGWEDRPVTPESVGFDETICARIRRDWLAARAVDIQATEIRKRCRRGRSIRWLVPEAVRACIEEWGLYRSLTDRAKEGEIHGGAGERNILP